MTKLVSSRELSTQVRSILRGPFDVVDAGVAGGNKTRLRIIVPRGKSEEAKYAAESTKHILELLEEASSLLPVCPRTDSEVPIRLRKPQFIKEYLRHRCVIVLPGVDEHLGRPEILQRGNHGSSLHEIRTSAERRGRVGQYPRCQEDR